ncbi:bacteriocin [Persicimonas caeni]|uniref:Bacteriocin n=1 Tax=Persicimonas caeni TaxID=2292766 RepID=A0A4Y6PNH6_PERCE|nr:family 1 encapsulin nanocompartment shell protein [Persicimonas caeni]QDG49577.1 bacteriocin [Persicimonas caeni]QED30798.1 bacteriocin [Persicimonas caeni]
MNDLFRERAPITEEAWREIEEEAVRVLKRTLAARKIVDFSGPHGWKKSSVDLGRVEPLSDAPQAGTEANIRKVQPLVELRVPFELSRREVEAAGRGAENPELEPVTDAARKAALAEDRSVFHGFRQAGIDGIFEVSARLESSASPGFENYPIIVAEALDRLRIEGVSGPYAIVLGRDCYTGLSTTHIDGYPVIEDVKRMLDGPVIWAPGVDGAVVTSLRGGDFELTVGRDFSIGYLSHDVDKVQLYLEESFTFRILAPEAAVPLPTVCK